MMSEGLRHATVTADDHGAILQIVTWFMMVAMVLAVSLRLAIRTAMRSAGWDDALAAIAMFLSISNTIAISLAVTYGLGQRDHIRYRAQTDTLQKTIWLASTLYLSTITLAKLSTLSLIARLIQNHDHKRMKWFLFVFVIAWCVAGVLANAFQCRLPKPWDTEGGHCFATLAFWIAVGSVDIVTDFALIILPFCVVIDLQMRARDKVIVLLAFACRIVVVAATITRLVYLHKLRDTADPYWDSIAFHISTQCQQTIAVIVACVPSLKVYMNSTTSGMLNLSLANYTGPTYGQASYCMTHRSVTKTGGSDFQGSSQHTSPELNSDSPRRFSNPGQLRSKVAFPADGDESMTEDRNDNMSATSQDPINGSF